MDFFQHQERARQRTGLLLSYFFLAVFLTVLAVNAAFWLGSRYAYQPGLTFGGWFAQPPALWATLITLAIILFGSLSKYFQLRTGGAAIAEMVGARLLDTDTTDPKERQLLNIVEEMSIASGTPPPTTWVIDHEAGINAFVAGFSPNEATLVVTRGALTAFDRDEMQGVIGHEFSHILNGDMRLNVNLYAILSGILAIGRVGEFLLRSGSRASSHRSRDGKGGGFLTMTGLALLLIGYVGLFFGRLIKAAISRQRELLADASSVQFTRNPHGIGGALLKIRNASEGSLLGTQYAEDMSHMCFALPLRLRLQNLFATHPPLDERIAAIDPTLHARDRARRRNANTPAAPTTVAGGNGNAAMPAATSGFAGAAAARAATGAPAVQTIDAIAFLSSTGAPTPAHLDAAGQLRDSLPAAVREAMHTSAGARAVVCGLLLASSEARHDRDALARLAAADSLTVSSRLANLLPELRRLPARARLPCLDLAIPALRQMSADQKSKFLALLEELVMLDGRRTLREFILVSLLRKHLAADAGALHPVRHRSYAGVTGAVNTVLSLLTHAGGLTGNNAVEHHARLMRGFANPPPALLPTPALGAAQLGAAFDELAALSPLLKKPLLDACIEGVLHDGRLHVAEQELLRAVGDALDCPIPPAMLSPA